MPCANCVDNASLATSAVQTANIVDGAVTNAKLATTVTSDFSASTLVLRDGSGRVRSNGVETPLGTDLMLLNGASAYLRTRGWGSNIYLGFNAGQVVDNMTTGNTALGFNALKSLTTGGGNIALGSEAGANLTLGISNVYIGSVGPAAQGAESNTARIGASNITRTFIAGIRGSVTGVMDGINVIIDSDGQLGTVSSSARFKHDIRDLGDRSSLIHLLRPTSFRYLPSLDASQTETVGLIAEEVARVLPELVARDKDGNIETVKYHLLPVYMLGEIQKLRAEVDALKRSLEDRK